jgi:hypothetical protein
MLVRPRPRWRIQHALFWSRFFARLAGPGDGYNRFELHDELARLYFELSASYRQGGDRLRAARVERIAIYHSVLSTPPELPPADSMLLAVGDATYTRTDARGAVIQPPEVPFE